MESTDFEKKVTATQVKEQPAYTEPVIAKYKIKPTVADIRYDLHALSDALIIAPRKDRKFANDVIKVIKNTIKISQPKNAHIKKNGFDITVYNVDELRLEIENKAENGEKREYPHPRMITVFNRKTGMVIDRITKPFLVAKVFLTLVIAQERIIKSKETLESVQGTLKKMSERQNQK